MGNNNSSSSVPGPRQRRLSTAGDEPLMIPVPVSGGRFLSPDDQQNFASNLMRSAALNDSGSPEAFVGRYRADSLVGRPPPSTLPTNEMPTYIKWDRGGKEVFVAGSFNNWRKIPLVKSANNLGAIVNLPPGEHEYKFFVDGQWVHHPDQPTKVSVEGTSNNMVSINMCDGNIEDALSKDAELSKHVDELASSPQDDYTQDIPKRNPTDRNTGPPILPPHLLQVILNKDTPLHMEPSLLPEPNHVMLNHLYALSIKDGVMVLSSTKRHKKKYVTSLFYKPIET